MNTLRNEIRYTRDGKLVRMFNQEKGKWVMDTYVSLNDEEIDTVDDDFTLITYFNNIPYGRVGSEIYANMNDDLHFDRNIESLHAIMETFPDVVSFVPLREYECGSFMFTEMDLIMPGR